MSEMLSIYPKEAEAWSKGIYLEYSEGKITVGIDGEYAHPSPGVELGELPGLISDWTRDKDIKQLDVLRTINEVNDLYIRIFK